MQIKHLLNDQHSGGRAYIRSKRNKNSGSDGYISVSLGQRASVKSWALRRSLNVISPRTQWRSADQRPVQELAELLPRHVPVPELADNRPLPLAL